MKFIILNGPSCSGKSTIVQSVMEKREGLYHLARDKQKWFFSKYDRHIHHVAVRNIVIAIAEAVCSMKYDIICDSPVYPEHRDKLLEIPQRHGYEIIEINLEADYKILLERFKRRVAEAEAGSKKRISNRSEERFNELVKMYEDNRNLKAKVIRTDEESIEDITDDIIKCKNCKRC